MQQQQTQFNNYPNIYFPQMQLNYQQIGFIDGNCPNGYYYPPPPYQIPPGMMGVGPMTYYPPYVIDQPKNLKSYLDNICNRGVVNNIIGAFYIKECQEKQKILEQKKVPISMVELNDEQVNNNINNNVNSNKINNQENEKIKIENGGQMRMPHFVDETKKNEKKNDEKEKNIKMENNRDDEINNKNNDAGKNNVVNKENGESKGIQNNINNN